MGHGTNANGEERLKKDASLQPTATDGNVWVLTTQRVPICLCLRACAGDDIVSPSLTDANDYTGVDAKYLATREGRGAVS